MSNKVIGQSPRNQVKSLSEQVKDLQKTFVQLVFQVEQQLNSIGQRLDLQNESIEALCELNGTEEVAKIITDKRIERMRAEATQEEASLQAGLTAGYVLPEEKVGGESMIVGRFYKPDGEVEEPGRVQYEIAGIGKAFRDKLIEQVVGFKMDLPNGGSFELQGIYRNDAEKEKAFQEAEAAKAQAAVVAAQLAAADDDTDIAKKIEESEGGGQDLPEVGPPPSATEEELTADKA